MKQLVSPLFQVGICTVGYLSATSSATIAQVTSDGTVNTQVNQNGNIAEITGGETRGSNLFHSFQDFSVGTGNEAFFNNANDISNIFSRVTGGNVSNIDGAIRANGSASLFLINPAGIIFGNNARLDIGGSFYGSTASSILFEDGEFSAADLENPPLLTVNAPIGLGFRDNPGGIVNRSVAQNLNGENNLTSGAVGLQVANGETLGLIGGNILFDNGNITAKGGHIEIGSVLREGDIGISQTDIGLIFNYDSITSFGDIRIENMSVVEVSSEGNGDISFNASNINLLDGSSLNAGISPELGTTNAQAGNITLNAQETLTVTNSRIHNIVNNQAIGNSGNIFIRASQVEVLETLNSDVDVDSGNFLNNGIFSSVNLEGRGNAGNISIESQQLNVSGNGARISTATLGEGNAGDLTIQTEQLSVLDGAQIGASTFGRGNAGIFTLRASESINVSGSGDVFPSGLFANVSEEAENGNVGSLTIETKNFNISDNARVSASSFGTGDGGDLTITTERLFVENGGQVQAVAFGDGSAGDLTINASDSIELRGATEEVRTGVFASAIDSNENGGSGDGGNLNIFTDKLIVEDGAIIGVSNFQSLDLVPPGRGAAGNLEINANSIDLNGGIISAANANGVGGSLEINADSVSLDNSSSINAFTTSATGQGGIIDLNIDNILSLRNNSEISALTEGTAAGGTVSINANFIIALPNETAGNGNDIIANAAEGNGGIINIAAESLLGFRERQALESNRTNDIDASSSVNGLDGIVNITTPGINLVQGLTELPSNVVEPEQTAQQACEANREAAAKNSLNISGKGGVVPDPALPLNSLNVIANDENTSTSAIAAPIETAQGKIQPARGVRVTESGKVILTAYRTNNSGDRISDGSRNCGRV